MHQLDFIEEVYGNGIPRQGGGNSVTANSKHVPTLRLRPYAERKN